MVLAERRLAAGDLWLWIDGESPVSLAGYTQPAAGVARIGPLCPHLVVVAMDMPQPLRQGPVRPRWTQALTTSSIPIWPTPPPTPSIRSLDISSNMTRRSEGWCGRGRSAHVPRVRT